MSAARDLLAELDAEFGKAARKKKAETDKEIVKALNKTYHQRNYTGTVSDILAESNAIAGSWAKQPGWRAVRRVTHVFSQHCENCGSTVEFIGNMHCEFENKRMHAKVQAQEIVTHDELGFEIPHTLEEHFQDVPFCVACLRLSRRVSDHLEAALLNGVPKQMDLQIKAERSL